MTPREALSLLVLKMGLNLLAYGVIVYGPAHADIQRQILASIGP